MLVAGASKELAANIATTIELIRKRPGLGAA
jgi:hypothetical protein